MWLLDANMDVHLAGLLEELGIACDTAAHREWKALSNGQLVAAAFSKGFECLLTRDRLFEKLASRALQLHLTFAVVLVNLPQQRWTEYLQSFSKAWAMSPIKTQPGNLVEWPTNH